MTDYSHYQSGITNIGPLTCCSLFLYKYEPAPDLLYDWTIEGTVSDSWPLGNNYLPIMRIGKHVVLTPGRWNLFHLIPNQG